MRPFYPLLDRVWDARATHIKTLCPGNHGKGLADELSVERLKDGEYVLFYAQIRAFRKLRSLERQEACCKYLIYRFPSEYQLVRGTKNAVEKRYVAADVQRRKEDHRFKIRIPCRVQGIGVDDFSSDEPMDIDIEVKADDSFDAVCAVENAIKALITKKD